MINDFSIRIKALSIAKGFNSGLSSIKGSELFDLKTHNGLISYLMYEDIYLLHELAINPKYNIVSSKDKFKVYDEILGPRGFIRKYSGTNRVIYQHISDDTFILKIGIDSVGIDANKFEFYNQNVLKPFIPKVYDISKCGTVSLMEKVEPITNKDMFLLYANEIFNVIIYLIDHGYLLEDIGTDFFMNWGIRYGFGPVLLDFPYIYRVNKSRLVCTMINIDGTKCDGHIIYDDGFNFLMCNKCGKRYAAKDIGSSFRYLNEINKKLKRSEDAMDYVIKAENMNGSFEIKNGANVIVDQKTSYTIMSKFNSNEESTNRKEHKEKEEVVSKQETLFNKPKVSQDRNVKNDNLKMESILKEFNLEIDKLDSDLITFIEQKLVIDVDKYMRVSQFIVRTSEVESMKNSGILSDQEEKAKKILHTNRLMIMENDLFTHYFAPNVYYDINKMGDVVRDAIREYLDHNQKIKDIDISNNEKKIEDNVEVQDVPETQYKELEMKVSGNALGNSTITSKTAYVVNGSKPNTASEY